MEGRKVERGDRSELFSLSTMCLVDKMEKWIDSKTFFHLWHIWFIEWNRRGMTSQQFSLFTLVSYQVKAYCCCMTKVSCMG